MLFWSAVSRGIGLTRDLWIYSILKYNGSNKGFLVLRDELYFISIVILCTIRESTKSDESKAGSGQRGEKQHVGSDIFSPNKMSLRWQCANRMC